MGKKRETKYEKQTNKPKREVNQERKREKNKAKQKYI